MQRIKCVLLSAAVLASAVIPALGQTGRDKIEIVKPSGYTTPTFARSVELQELLSSAVKEVSAEKNVKQNELAVTVIDITDPANMKIADVEGELQLYTASVVKMFYMAALHRQLEDGKITLSKEMERGLKDMIVDSSNEATQYILDVLTDTSSGSELPQDLFEKWQYKRNRVNRFFSSLGYSNININQKTFCEDAYGIEQQSRNYKGQNRNMLTTNASARLMAEIALRRFVNERRSELMLELMQRDWSSTAKDAASQAVNFTGKALIDEKIADAKLWSKAGWTSRSRHDVAYIETGGKRIVLAIFTENHANDKEIISKIAARVIKGMRG